MIGFFLLMLAVFSFPLVFMAGAYADEDGVAKFLFCIGLAMLAVAALFPVVWALVDGRTA